jgi:hypothetical protein
MYFHTNYAVKYACDQRDKCQAEPIMITGTSRCEGKRRCPCGLRTPHRAKAESGTRCGLRSSARRWDVAPGPTQTQRDTRRARLHSAPAGFV